MSQKNIAILMSTYNGDKYLKTQIQSIINQKYTNWHLYIRDDGSTDKTIEIIEEFEKKEPRISFFNRKNIKNVGVTRSFIDLLNNVNADYYMFSDQDDYWMPNKISICLNKISKVSGPTCVFTELQVVNKNLKLLHLMNNSNVWFDFPHFLFGNCVTGCTMMINNDLKSLLLIEKTNFQNVYLHDWWIAMICASFGKLLYVSTPTIYYRQHGDNAEGSKKDNLKTIAKRTLHLDHEITGMAKILAMDYEFNRLFGDQINGINYQYIKGYSPLFNCKNISFINRLIMILKLPPLRTHLRGKFLFSYLILFKYHNLTHKINIIIHK
ncbi:glycosyltransferase, group 2 family protein [Limosilactobacillus coleohominis DSM 14060]|nr:glycosyltransferase, group 2 family protein [Limosilactobacillus coleohominis DSM 14060]